MLLLQELRALLKILSAILAWQSLETTALKNCCFCPVPLNIVEFVNISALNKNNCYSRRLQYNISENKRKGKSSINGIWNGQVL